MEMTPEALKAIIKKHNGYSSALELNDKMYAHFMGFDKIENLEPYTGLKCLYMEKNAIETIENLDHLRELTSLYLQENLIRKVENLSELRNLYTINLSHNYISAIEGLENLDKLNTLIIHHNDIKETKSLQGLLDCPSIGVLDLSENKLAHEDALDVLEKLPNLKVLYLKGNPFVKKMRNYRKRVTVRFPKLTYLDDRPIFPNDRKIAEAWAKGGKEGERKERDRIRKAEHDEAKRRNQVFFEKFCKRNNLDDQGKRKENKRNKEAVMEPVATETIQRLVQEQTETEDEHAEIAEDLEDIPKLVEASCKVQDLKDNKMELKEEKYDLEDVE
mmetsp:Transcript_9339/g.13018  ORF Transcript_9339/g.13018 Transcript_9339/m.13018 type:complete len:331 (+) Transcript_9339:126-1118(+)|eukprot:CAMPEP_0184486628 /NCGR_PEP_ID=MMETSP0113_2-20130426/8105_1 /TAXON_ID=91329 /ORGANISM="Norrisiella sphaerica, Strain BC52" /LENGTH=330 /DNA_ID=CAMNT_0026868591 /DNA_START=87 /DNA_END=1079 /DNA_ORIENTATION=+